VSLYESLDQFVGAGVLAAAPALGVEVPAGAVATGAQLSNLLRGRGEAAQVGAVLDALARDVWLSQQTLGVPHSVAEEQAGKLVAVLERCRPEPQQILAAIEKSRSGLAGHANGAVPPQRRIAETIMARATESGSLKEAGIWDEVAAFLLERLYAHLIDDPGLLASLRPAMEAHLAGLGAVGAATAKPSHPLASLAREPKPQGKAEPRSVAAPEPAPDTPPALPALEPGQAAAFTARGELAAVAAIQQRYGLTDRALQRFLDVLDKAAVVVDERLVRLEDMASWLKATLEQLARPSNEDADTRRLKAQAAAALADGDFETAVEQLKLVKRRVRAGRRRIEARLDEEMRNLRAQMSEESLANVGLAELAMARFDYLAAADIFAEAADCLPAGDAAGALSLAMRQADALYRHGTDNGDVTALKRANALYADALHMASDAGDARAAAAAHHALGNVLYRLGEKEGGDSWLKEAVAAYRRALQGISRQGEPRLFAMTQLHLGHAFSSLGDRTGDVGHHRDAGAAYREALQELSRERAPSDWAAAQAGLGNALLNLEGSEPNRHLMSEAVLALGNALKVLTRERMPRAWANAQMNLGNALLGLGEQEARTSRIEEAVAAYRQSLFVFTREADPQSWSLAMMNVGNALASLGEREAAGVARLEEAVEAYRAALEVLSREATPMRWAVTQMNLGTVLIRIGERKEMRRNWLAAAAAMVPALEVFETSGAKDYAALTRRNLKKFHEQWDSLINGEGGG